MFSHDVIDVAQENFGIALWFTYLNFKQINYFLTKFDCLRDERLIFTWGQQ